MESAFLSLDSVLICSEEERFLFCSEEERFLPFLSAPFPLHAVIVIRGRKYKEIIYKEENYKKKTFVSFPASHFSPPSRVSHT
jgi:hypothetical protein